MNRRKIILLSLSFLILVVCVMPFWRIRQSDENIEKYGSHGFEYMHGYSSSDFTGYHVYDGEKLHLLDHDSSFSISKQEDMPILDGAEACYPVYSAVAKTVYEGIDEIELDNKKKAEDYWEKGRNGTANYSKELSEIYRFNGKIVTFTNTSFAYNRLITGEADMIFAARPSEQQKENASQVREQIQTMPIGKEAFVFFVEEDNPVNDLSSEQLRAIYHGDISNWKEVGGPNQKIVAFQRPENSGSQVMMKWFMNGITLKDPLTYERVSAMGGVVDEVAQYNNEAGAIGYSFRYFLTGLKQEEHVKILSVDGIYPDIETIKNGTYPATVDLVCATLVSNTDPYVEQMKEFLLSDDGQAIIEGNGYAALPDRNVKTTIENELSDITPRTYISEDGNWTLNIYDGDPDRYSIFELYKDAVFYKGVFYTYEGDSEFYERCGTNGLVPFSHSFENYYDYNPSEDTYMAKRYEFVDFYPEDVDLPEPGTLFIRSQ